MLVIFHVLCEPNKVQEGMWKQNNISKKRVCEQVQRVFLPSAATKSSLFLKLNITIKLIARTGTCLMY